VILQNEKSQVKSEDMVFQGIRRNPFIERDSHSHDVLDKKRVASSPQLIPKKLSHYNSSHSDEEPSSPPSSPTACSWPPHCQITLKSTKEVAGYNTISEAFHRLDFTSAITDIRRFNYVTKLLHLLINQNLTTLSGCATKVLFSMLEQLAWQGKRNSSWL
jgi:hypothetical protein